MYVYALSLGGDVIEGSQVGTPVIIGAAAAGGAVLLILFMVILAVVVIVILIAGQSQRKNKSQHLSRSPGNAHNDVE